MPTNSLEPRGGVPALLRLSKGGKGTVACASERVVNLIFDDSFLIGLQPAGAPVHPFSVAGIAPLDIFTQGDSFTLSGMVLELGSGFSFRLLDSLAVNLEVEECTRPESLRYPKLVQHFNTLPLPEFTTQTRTAVLRFVKSGSPTPLTNLIGLGSGLTPSLDDSIIGLLSLLRHLRGLSPIIRKYSELLETAIETLPGVFERTTRLSGQLLREAARGYFGETLIAIYTEPAASPEFADALKRLTETGAQSGADTMLGICCGLEALNLYKADYGV